MHDIENRILVLFLALVGVCVQLRAQQAPQYNVTVLPKLPQMESVRPLGINNLGEVVGYWYSSGDPYLGFLYSNGTMIDLGPLIGGESNQAYDINDNGQIVGPVNYGGRNGTAVFVFSLAEGVKTLAAGMQSTPTAINNAGQIIGWQMITEGGFSHMLPAIFLQNGTVITLEQYYSGMARGINDHYMSNGLGQVVGWVTQETTPSKDEAFLYTDGAMMFNMSSTTCEGLGFASSAWSINNAEQITGNCANPLGQNAIGFIYNATNGYTYYFEEHQMASFINDDGWVVGFTNVPSDYPFLFINGAIYNLYDLIPFDTGIEQLEPVAMNNQGQIAANSNLGPVLLTPIQPD